MKKRMITVILSGILACSLAACGSTEKSNTEMTTKTHTVTQESDTSTESSSSSASTSKTKQNNETGSQKTTDQDDASQQESQDSTSKNSNAQENATQNTSKQSTTQVSTTNSKTTGTTEDSDELFTERDLNQSPDLSSAKTITVSGGQTINITEEGIYLIKGTASNCTIRVETDSASKVQLVLDGVSITNTDHSAIYVVSADKCFITTTGSTSTLTVTGEFASDDTTGDAVIYSKDDLVLNGTGQLTILSSKGNGISCKDDLKITGGTYNITSAEDSLEANDSISIKDGNFTIKSSKDGLHSEYSDDDTVGSIYIAGGTFKITVASDAIQATSIATIDGGTFDITTGEGIEATYVRINGGTINISASDDGINASKKSSAYSTPTVEINGGQLTIVMGQGDTDAIDANGNIIVNGGTIDITAQMSSFDYDGTATYNGGTIIINGSQVDSIPQPTMGGGGMGGRGDMNSGFGGRMR